ncbi:SURF1 family protein [Parerythrobacter aestuarii]|uniref:SURF1 family protein n=1 Tax=Parerythrobacter aestuarii TaxID=3020909 RepID=UPI0024DEB061|nr:SURF1 family protein [Parerythrobacter aestuarii]
MPKFPLIPTLVVVIAVGIMVSLGFWQLGRMQEKEAMIASYEAAVADHQVDNSHWPHESESAYRTVEFYCAGPHTTKVRAGRNANGETGWRHIVQCLLGGPDPTDESTPILPDYEYFEGEVALGWSRDPESIRWQGGMVRGVVEPGSKYGGRIVADPPLAGLQPLAKPDPRNLPNNHLSYAVQWFLFALTALVIYILALKRRQRGG